MPWLFVNNESTGVYKHGCHYHLADTVVQIQKKTAAKQNKWQYY